MLGLRWTTVMAVALFLIALSLVLSPRESSVTYECQPHKTNERLTVCTEVK
jgi:hypothetical protein